MKFTKTLAGILLSVSLAAGCASVSKPSKLIDTPKTVSIAVDALSYLNYKEIKKDQRSVNGTKDSKMDNGEDRKYQTSIDITETTFANGYGHDFDVAARYSLAKAPDKLIGRDVIEEMFILSFIKVSYNSAIAEEKLNRMSYEEMVNEGLIRR